MVEPMHRYVQKCTDVSRFEGTVEEHWTFRFQFIDGEAKFVGAYKDGKSANIKPYAKLSKEGKLIAKSGDTETVKEVIAGDTKADRDVTCVSDGVYDIIVTHHVKKKTSKKRYVAALRKIIRRNRGGESCQ